MSESRIDVGSGYRTCFGMDGPVPIILLGRGTKSRQQPGVEVAGLTNKTPKSLMRMPGPHGNPQARNRFQIIGCLERREGVHLEVQTVR